MASVAEKMKTASISTTSFISGDAPVVVSRAANREAAVVMAQDLGQPIFSELPEGLLVRIARIAIPQFEQRTRRLWLDEWA